MRNWKDTTGTLEGDCPWYDDHLFAELVAKRLDIPFHMIDLSDEYRRRVVDYMFAEYERGRTPNPDVLCNLEIKFDAFSRYAAELGGKYVLPGAVDVHTHMDLQAGAHRAVDDFYTGTVAAACGGTTTIVDHMAFGPKGCSLWHQVEEYHRLADGKAVIDYGFHGVLQHVDERVLREMGELADREGITSFKALSLIHI